MSRCDNKLCLWMPYRDESGETSGEYSETHDEEEADGATVSIRWSEGLRVASLSVCDARSAEGQGYDGGGEKERDKRADAHGFGSRESINQVHVELTWKS